MKKLHLSIVIWLLLLSGCYIDVSVEGRGTVNSSSGKIVSCDETGSGTCVANYTAPMTETFTAIPDPGWTFLKWEDSYSLPICDGDTILTCVYTLNSGSFTPEYAGFHWTLKAVFVPDTSCP